MLLFIDESGDAGLKLGSGSSKYFVIAIVAFEDHEEALAATDRINLLKREMGFSDRVEFHFNQMKPRHRRTFLSAVAAFNFLYWGIVINKEKLTHRNLPFQKSIYQYACGLVFENAKQHLSNAIVVIDGTGMKGFGKQLKTYLGRRLKDDSGRRRIKKLKMQDSKQNNLLQLTDMVVGSIARSYSHKQDAEEYRKLIAHREIEVEFWPK